jgi:hypothetical protein
VGSKPAIRGNEASKVKAMLVKGGSIRGVAKAVGRSPGAIANFRKANKELIEVAKEKINQRIIEEAVPSINKMVELRDGGKSEQVQLGAAKELLEKAESRTGTQVTKHTPMIFNINIDKRGTKEPIKADVVQEDKEDEHS